MTQRKEYLLRAAKLSTRAQAETDHARKVEIENLARAYLRLAEQAERNSRQKRTAQAFEQAVWERRSLTVQRNEPCERQLRRLSRSNGSGILLFPERFCAVGALPTRAGMSNHIGSGNGSGG